jgi:pimeloyl-ACP methyl ester carboxylesterase
MWILALAFAASAGSPELSPGPEVRWVQGPDGGWSALHHYPTAAGPPVILCHGISSNHRFWDLDPDHSLALWLQKQGFDVWNLDLRGHGAALKTPEGKRQKAGWSMDDYGKLDLPAVIAEVTAATGQPTVSYVGHSMGGMVLAVYLATHGDDKLQSAVVVGSPLDFRDPDLMYRLLLGAAPAVRDLAFLPSDVGAKAIAPFGRDMLYTLDEMVLNPDNFDPKVALSAYNHVVSPLSRGEFRQFGRIGQGDEFVSADGTVRYREALGGVTAPMLFLAGRADRVVSPDRVYGYYEAVGSKTKEFVTISVANGYSGDYGHLDFGLAEKADDEVFPLIGAWLRRAR